MLGGIQVDIRIDGELIPLETEADLHAFLGYLQNCASWMAQRPRLNPPAPEDRPGHAMPMPPPSHSEKGSVAPIYTPPVAFSSRVGGFSSTNPEPRSPAPLDLPSPERASERERGIHYMLRILQSLDRDVSVAELLDAMLEVGWTTNSATRRKQMETVRSIARYNSQTIHYHDGMVGLRRKTSEESEDKPQPPAIPFGKQFAPSEHGRHLRQLIDAVLQDNERPMKVMDIYQQISSRDEKVAAKPSRDVRNMIRKVLEADKNVLRLPDSFYVRREVAVRYGWDKAEQLLEDSPVVFQDLRLSA